MVRDPDGGGAAGGRVRVARDRDARDGRQVGAQVVRKLCQLVAVTVAVLTVMALTYVVVTVLDAAVQLAP